MHQIRRLSYGQQSLPQAAHLLQSKTGEGASQAFFSPAAQLISSKKSKHIFP